MDSSAYSLAGSWRAKLSAGSFTDKIHGRLKCRLAVVSGFVLAATIS